MARYFFDASSEDLLVTDFHGRDISDKEEVREAMAEAVRSIRRFLGDEFAAQAWDLEVRLGEHNRVATIRFEEIESLADENAADGALSFAA